MARRTKEDVIKLLEECKAEYIKDEDLMYYRYFLNQKGLSTTNYANWCNKGIQEINDIRNTLEELQESRLVNELIKKKSRVNVTGAIFALKAYHGAMEEEKRLQLQKESNAINGDVLIEIGYEEVEDGTESKE